MVSCCPTQLKGQHSEDQYLSDSQRDRKEQMTTEAL